MNDTIRREDTIKAVGEAYAESDTWESIETAIRSIPSADKSGRWIDKGGTWYCSECGTEDAYACDERNGEVYDFFCPHCGARMEGVNNILYEPTYNSEDGSM